jgi:hypothetical protein
MRPSALTLPIPRIDLTGEKTILPELAALVVLHVLPAGKVALHSAYAYAEG